MKSTIDKDKSLDIIEDAQRMLQAYGDMPVDELIRTLLEESGVEMDKDTFLAIAGYGLHPIQQRIIAKAAQYQADVMLVMAVLPGKHRYESVEAAITASGIPARDIYMDLAAGQPTVALARFYEALGTA